MAELETKSDCCEPAVHETCCEPEATSECCGDGPSCGCSAGKENKTPAAEIREVVRERYAAAATDAGSAGASCCANDAVITPEQRAVFGSKLYEDSDCDALPEAAQLASLGCGNPTAVADLAEGQVVLDLGSGGGIDVLLSAGRVGPSGKAYGLDMTDEMLELARRNQREAGVENVEFLRGEIENIPLPDSSVDVIISNCVINLSTDKPAVVAEMARVLKPGGRIGISDVVAQDCVTPEERAERGSWVGCIAGALSYSEYRTLLANEGFDDISITATHEATEGMDSAIIKAIKPA